MIKKVLHKKITKYLAALIALILVIFLFMNISLYVVFNILTPSICSAEIVTEDISPNNTYKAITFVKNCGATTPFSTQVAIVDSNEEFYLNIQPILTTDTNHGDSPTWEWGGPEIKTEWETDEHLIIYLHPLTRTFKKEMSYYGIDISYKDLNK